MSEAEKKFQWVIPYGQEHSYEHETAVCMRDGWERRVGERLEDTDHLFLHRGLLQQHPLLGLGDGILATIPLVLIYSMTWIHCSAATVAMRPLARLPQSKRVRERVRAVKAEREQGWMTQ
jgi:hypothetical protein